VSSAVDSAHPLTAYQHRPTPQMLRMPLIVRAAKDSELLPPQPIPRKFYDGLTGRKLLVRMTTEGIFCPITGDQFFYGRRPSSSDTLPSGMVPAPPQSAVGPFTQPPRRPGSSTGSAPGRGALSWAAANRQNAPMAPRSRYEPVLQGDAARNARAASARHRTRRANRL
jgi:hypothetical protein